MFLKASASFVYFENKNPYQLKDLLAQEALGHQRISGIVYRTMTTNKLFLSYITCIKLDIYFIMRFELTCFFTDSYISTRGITNKKQLL